MPWLSARRTALSILLEMPYDRPLSSFSPTEWSSYLGVESLEKLVRSRIYAILGRDSFLKSVTADYTTNLSWPSSDISLCSSLSPPPSVPIMCLYTSDAVCLASSRLSKVTLHPRCRRSTLSCLFLNGSCNLNCRYYRPHRSLHA